MIKYWNRYRVSALERDIVQDILYLIVENHSFIRQVGKRSWILIFAQFVVNASGSRAVGLRGKINRVQRVI